MATARIGIGAETLTSLATKVQREVGDPDEDRWLLTDIYDAINDALLEAATVARLSNGGDAITYVEMAYTGGAPADLPAAYASVFRVQDVTTSPRGIDIPYVPYPDFYPSGSSAALGALSYTLLAETTDHKTGRIEVAPSQGRSMTLRLFVALQPWVVSTGADEIPIPSRFREYLMLGAASRLLARAREDTSSVDQRLAFQRELFARESHRTREPYVIGRGRRR
jgi:hypothetical protein